MNDHNPLNGIREHQKNTKSSNSPELEKADIVDHMINVDKFQPALLLSGRFLLVVIFFVGGFSLLKGSVPIDYAASKGVPAALVWIGFAIKLFCGFAVIIGFQTRLAAFGLIIFTLATAFIFHPYPDRVFLKEISMIGGLILLLATGPGPISLDAKMKKANR